MKNITETPGANAALGLALIIAVTLGCGLFTKKQTVPTTPPLQISRELRTTGTVTSASTGGSCSKKVDGKFVTTPQIGFSYSVDGRDYTSVGCTYDPKTAVGAKINVCYTTTSAAGAKPCSN